MAELGAGKPIFYVNNKKNRKIFPLVDMNGDFSKFDTQLIEHFFIFFTDIVETGISFYEKVLNKNIAIRELSGKDLYSVKGNEYPGIFRFNVFPLTTRKLFFETKLAEIRKKEAAESNENAKKTDDTNKTQTQTKTEWHPKKDVIFFVSWSH